VMRPCGPEDVEGLVAGEGLWNRCVILGTSSTMCLSTRAVA